VTWVFEAGQLSMALNPTDEAIEMDCCIASAPVSTGTAAIEGEVLRLGAWSAVSWSEPVRRA